MKFKYFTFYHFYYNIKQQEKVESLNGTVRAALKTNYFSLKYFKIIMRDICYIISNLMFFLSVVNL